MLEDGLREVANPSALFLARGDEIAAGNVVFASIEGSRPLLVQVQALVDRAAANPRRAFASASIASGWRCFWR